MRKNKLLIFLCALLYQQVAWVRGQHDSCGYKSCPATKPGYLNIHLVPHSHDDIGWLKTVDQYYYGDNSSIQQAAVQYTIDSVVEQLQKHKNRRFIYVETGFFWRWWTNQDEETQAIVQNLVRNGQLEFINGGWVMNDEAATHYNGIIDQMGLGLRWLNETFGKCAVPKVAWQIDPFGHSREQASLFAQMNFDGLFFGRLDYQDKYKRRVTKDMEFVWSGSPTNLKRDSNLFTGVLFNGYNPPDGFCFDIFCNDDPMNDDPKLFGYNVDEKVKRFIEVSHEWGAPYRSEHVLMTMGSDFQYLAAAPWYKNLDKLIKYVNARQLNGSRVNLIYSTPSCYLKRVNEANLSFKFKTDDFFPYASDPHAFWTGYFTSRPSLKYYVQKGNNFLQACKQIALASQLPDLIPKMLTMQEAIAVLQHHDAVSGTAKQHVTDDYSLRLHLGFEQCQQVIGEGMKSLLKKNDRKHHHPKLLQKEPSAFTFCQLLNISSCTFTETNEDFIVNVYNPLARNVINTYVRIPVMEGSYVVSSESGKIVSQLLPIPREVQIIPGRVSEAKCELVWKVDRLGGFGWGRFRVTRENDLMRRLIPIEKGHKKGKDFWVENTNIGLLFDGMTGLIKKFRRANVEMDFEQNFYFYEGMTGNNSKFEDRASGAYIFRPNSTISSQPIKITSRVFSYFVYKTEQVTEVHQVFTDWVSQIVRVYEGREEVEFEWVVGPIYKEDKIGKEIITRYTTNLKTDATFFTDANGREILKRVRDKRETWGYKVHEPVAGNYYPVNSRIIMSESEDLKGKTVIVLNDRAQGGTSMNDGEVELMLHRRLLFDDAFGVGEALDEEQFGVGLVARGKHWVLICGGEIPCHTHRPLAQEIYMDRILSFSNVVNQAQLGNEIDLVDLSFKTTLFTGLGSVLPPNVHVLTLEPLTPKQFLLRLEHIYETGESEEWSWVVKISRNTLQEALPMIASMRETTLGGNIWKDEATRLEWVVEGEECPNDGECTQNNYLKDQGDIVLRPMEIRTFVVNVK